MKKKIPKPAERKTKKTPKPSGFSLSESTVHRTKVRVIGIGGGGGTIVSEIISRIKKADFYIANTDVQALQKSAKGAKRFQFGQSLTRGLGTGMNVEIGEQAAQEEKERIRKILENQDLCILVACLGGGTSSGAAPVFAKIAKSLGNITYGIFTLPFSFEGEKKMEIARESLEKIKTNLNAYTVIPNERIFRIIDKNTPLKNALSAINEKLAENLGGLLEMIYLPGLINIDFADLNTILAGRGRLTYLNTLEVEEARKEEGPKKLISSPLYPYSIKGARGILYNITGGKGLQLEEVSRLSEIISGLVNKKAKIIFGIGQDPKYQKKVKITLLASGCGLKGFLNSPKKNNQKAKPIVSLVQKAEGPEAAPSGENKEEEDKKEKKPNSVLKNAKNPKPPSKSNSSKKKPSKKKPSKKKPSKKKKPIKKKIRSSKKRTRPAAGKIQKPKKKPKPKKKKPEPPAPEKEKKDSLIPEFFLGFGEGKVRRSALELKKVVEEEEKELVEKEKIWETPAIFRRKKNDINDV